MNKTDKEVWKYVEWYNNYLVSTHGRIMRLPSLEVNLVGRIVDWMTYKYWGWNTNYLRASLIKNWKQYLQFIHRLVAQAFLWLDMTDKTQIVAHLDHNWLNNHVSNLMVATDFENRQQTVDMYNSIPMIERVKRRKRKYSKEYPYIINALQEWKKTATEIANETWVPKCVVVSYKRKLKNMT